MPAVGLSKWHYILTLCIYGTMCMEFNFVYEYMLNTLVYMVAVVIFSKRVAWKVAKIESLL